MTVADLVLAELAPPRLVVAALSLGNTIGQTVVAIPLVLVTRRICGQAAVQGIGRAACPAWPPGRSAVRSAWPSTWPCPCTTNWTPSPWPLPAAAGAIIAFGVVAFFLDNGDLQAVLTWARRAAPRPRS